MSVKVVPHPERPTVKLIIHPWAKTDSAIYMQELSGRVWSVADREGSNPRHAFDSLDDFRNQAGADAATGGTKFKGLQWEYKEGLDGRSEIEREEAAYLATL